MKKQIMIIITIFIFLANACNEDVFLKEQPRDDIFAENLYVNYDGFTNGMNALYALVRLGRTQSQHVNYDDLWKMGVDNAFINNGSGTIDPYNNYNNLNSENNLLRLNFNWLYRIINTSNLIIKRAEDNAVDWQGGNSVQDTANKNKIIAQAKLMRAWAYRHLRYGWGAVPLSLDEITGTTYRSDWERAPIEKIQEQMESDLLFARDHLNMIEETGRVNSAVASTMLAELYLDMEGREADSEKEALRVI